MLFFRRDLARPDDDCVLPGEWHIPTVGGLRALLNRLELPDDYELWPNRYGNFAVYRCRADRNDMRYYVGYLDLHAGTIHLNPEATPHHDDPDGPPGWPEQSPIHLPGRHTTIMGGEDQSEIVEGWRT